MTPTNKDALARVQQWSASSPMIDAAFNVLCNGGSILCPTHVGFTLVALDGKDGMARLDEVKVRQDKPYGIVGSEATFSRVFKGLKAPSMQNDFCSDAYISFMSSESVSDDAREKLRESRAVGPSGEVILVRE